MAINFLQMTLENFESLVEAKIVKRGLNYFKNGDVAKIEKVGEEEFNAVVFGTSLYEVYVRMTGKKIVKSYCSCPYDWGDTCKHEVAVYYVLRQGKFVDTGKKTKKILDNLHDDVLRRFVTNLIKTDRNFRNEFLRHFDEDFEEDDFDEYKRFDEYHY
jgi:uncharacterized Zn finger protein